MATILGDDRIDRDVNPSLGGEDFAYMLQESREPVSGLAQVRHRQKACCMRARFDFNDEVLPLGASYWAKLVESELAALIAR